MSTINFPADYRRAFAEFAEVPQSQVINDGTEFAVFDPATGKGKFYNYVHTAEQVAAFVENFPDWTGYIFVCSAGVKWVIHPL